ncbi:MAG: hypothetical protein EOP68_17760 [Sphingomonas sp.]|nr:MAG: hypothetical protein EOP68_17760 [Sphingomonas sp.]
MAYGIVAYRDAEWIAAARVSIVERAGRLDAMLVRHGLQARGECALFRLIEDDAAAALFERLAQAGILTRSFDHSTRWLRMGVPGDDDAFARLDEALDDG